MTNKTITLPHDLVDTAVNGYVQEQGHALNRIRELLASQHVVCSAGILCQNRECKECGGNGSYVPPLADPVPPAGGEPEVLRYMFDWAGCVTTSGPEQWRVEVERELPHPDFFKEGRVKNLVELVDRAHVTRLQAEVEQWKLAHRLAMQDNIKLQSELTKAREELKQAQVCERFVGYLLDNCEQEVIYEESLQHWMSEMLAKEANQSAPADKGQGEAVDDYPSTEIAKEAALGIYDIDFPSPDDELAEQPAPVADGTTSDKYKAELYDEVWQKARDMGFANVTDALTRLDDIDGVPRLNPIKQ